MEDYIDYLKALIGHLHHDAATFYANWKAAEKKAAEELQALRARIAELEAPPAAPAAVESGS
ncbi:MAG TPA: hypothetical protein VN667_05655 [Burkholderiales bacterium]|nr:hypothetical protein [Burkholderiales bacterium]